MFRQTNSEEKMIDWLHKAIDEGAGIIINLAAFVFASLVLLDALKMFNGPIIELHSNIHRREPIYHQLYASMTVTTVMAPLGAAGFPLALVLERLIAPMLAHAVHHLKRTWQILDRGKRRRT